MDIDNLRRLKNKLQIDFAYKNTTFLWGNVGQVNAFRENPFEIVLLWNLEGNVQDVGVVIENLGNGSYLLPKLIGQFLDWIKYKQEKGDLLLAGEDFNSNELVFSRVIYLYTSKVITAKEEIVRNFLNHGYKLKIREIVLSKKGDRKIALLCGNQNYTFLPRLKNTINDVISLSAKLSRLGFETVNLLDLTRHELDQRLKEWDKALANFDISLFYFAGHGFFSNGINYITPIDATPLGIELENSCVRVDSVAEITSKANISKRILIFDCCRLPGEGVDWTMPGMERLCIPDAYIAFSTSIGRAAKDGIGNNGRFTSSLLAHIERPNLRIQELFELVVDDVSNDTNGEQIPWTYSSLRGPFYFNPQNIW